MSPKSSKAIEKSPQLKGQQSIKTIKPPSPIKSLKSSSTTHIRTGSPSHLYRITRPIFTFLARLRFPRSISCPLTCHSCAAIHQPPVPPSDSQPDLLFAIRLSAIGRPPSDLPPAVLCAANHRSPVLPFYAPPAAEPAFRSPPDLTDHPGRHLLRHTLYKQATKNTAPRKFGMRYFVRLGPRGASPDRYFLLRSAC